MGITRSNLYKRRATGSKRRVHRMKKKYEIGRQSALTKLGGHRVRSLRVRGGNYKKRALRLELGNFAWGSEGMAKKARIVDVVYNAANVEYVRTKTIVKGAIVQIDCGPFRRWYEKQYNEGIARITTDVVAEEGMTSSQKKKFTERRKNHEVCTDLQKQFFSGTVLARIASRPGQVGRADGYVLEGPELAFYQHKLDLKQKKGKK